MAAFLGDGDDDTLETAFRAWNLCYQQAAMIVHVTELLEMAKISSNNIFANRLVKYFLENKSFRKLPPDLASQMPFLAFVYLVSIAVLSVYSNPLYFQTNPSSFSY